MCKIEKLHQLIERYYLTPEEVANLFIRYSGAQIITDDFLEYVKDEHSC